MGLEKYPNAPEKRPSDHHEPQKDQADYEPLRPVLQDQEKEPLQSPNEKGPGELSLP
jgi:hypothetical protein